MNNRCLTGWGRPDRQPKGEIACAYVAS